MTDLYNIVKASNKDPLKFQPNSVCWSKVQKRYNLDTSTDYAKTNCDIRLGYKYKNRYFVKPFFTFGQRTVAEGTSHIYQTLNVPIILYVRESQKCTRLEEKTFPLFQIHLYERLILTPFKCFKIPEGTTYMIFTLLKTQFSLDVVKEPFDIPFAWENPLQFRVKKFQSPFDKCGAAAAAKTPFIDDDERQDEKFDKQRLLDDELEMFQTQILNNNVETLQATQQLQQQIDSDLMTFTTTTAPESTTTTTFIQEPTNNMIWYYTAVEEPPPPTEEKSLLPILEKNIIINDTDFIKTWQKYIRPIYNKQPELSSPSSFQTNSMEGLLDLTIPKKNPYDSMDLDEIICQGENIVCETDALLKSLMDLA